MGNILIYLMVGFMFICGGLSSLYLIISLPTVLIYKIYRKVKFGENIM